MDDIYVTKASTARRLLPTGLFPIELYTVLYLDENYRFLGYSRLEGKTRTVPTGPRIRFIRRARDLGASRIITSHTHPNYRAWPSEQDYAFMGPEAEYFRTYNIERLDHLIISWHGWYSFRAGREFLNPVGADGRRVLW